MCVFLIGRRIFSDSIVTSHSSGWTGALHPAAAWPAQCSNQPRRGQIIQNVTQIRRCIQPQYFGLDDSLLCIKLKCSCSTYWTRKLAKWQSGSFF